jgi:hypothetical protein
MISFVLIEPPPEEELRAAEMEGRLKPVVTGKEFGFLSSILVM